MTTDAEKTGSGRLIPLDAFRGITIAAMIMVNYPGSRDHVYPPLLHVDWHGITPTDLIYVFIIYVPVYFLYRKKIFIRL